MIGIRTISFTLFLGLFACNGKDKDKSIPIIRQDREFDRVKLTDLENNPIALKQFEGKAVFINFWATWCKPCIEEMPSIEKAQLILRNENVVFLMASGESAEEIDAFRNSRDYKFNYVRIENSEELNIQVLPTTFIYSPEGKLVFSEMGYHKWDEKSNIDMILKIANKK